MKDKYSRGEFAARLGANGDPKLNAAADFTARLLNSPVGDTVARIVLFGSVSRGEARPDSDVDIMVFGSTPSKTLHRAAATASYEATLEWGESVEPLTYGLDDLFEPRAYVVYTALKRGREIYSMEEATIRYQEAVRLHRKAERQLLEAQAALAQNLFDAAVVLAFTAAELSAKALLLLKHDVALPSSHGGTIQLFGREYVKSGEVPYAWGQQLSEKYLVRVRALYDTQTETTRADAEPVLDLAGNLLNFLAQKLKEMKHGNAD